MHNFSIAIIITLFLFTSSYSKSYFVDFSNGDDSQNGMSTSQCFKHCPGDKNAVGQPAKTRLESGDTVFFRGSIVYAGTVTIPFSGQKGKPIVYDGNSDGQWGWDKAIVDGGNTRYYGFFSDAKSVSHIVVRNFEIRNCPANAVSSWAGGKGIYFNHCSFCQFYRCFIHDIGYAKNDGLTIPSGVGVKLVWADSCVVADCDITRCGESGIAVDGGNRCVIDSNVVHDYITWGIDLSASSRTCAFNLVSRNTIHDLYQFDNGFYQGTGDPPHTDYVFIRKANGSRPIHNIVENNLFYNNRNFTDFGGTAMTFLSYADSTIIQNNVYINAHSYSACFFGWTSKGTIFQGNTVYSPRTAAVRLETSGNTAIVNNTIVGASSVVTFESDNDERNLTIDDNTYCMPLDGKCFARATPYQGWSFSAWQTRGYDKNSIVYLSVADIKFVNNWGYPLHCETMDLRRNVSTQKTDVLNKSLAEYPSK